ncbi:hypothetical protein PGTUg99_005480 [Puccinia graminis f. sp. tritici]|uniref:Uncharacterized protein n=1 Tax=Puccinia graminis f. sp. tritici TaxID=56615 RepID=A0A5B0R3P3_PUCGR|nr:hypothetical protein PGTUg99_005480 [Puccinia graminis f. sp. tritici]
MQAADLKLRSPKFFYPRIITLSIYLRALPSWDLSLTVENHSLDNPSSPTINLVLAPLRTHAQSFSALFNRRQQSIPALIPSVTVVTFFKVYPFSYISQLDYPQN